MKCSQKVCVLKGTLVALLQPQEALNLLQDLKWDFSYCPMLFPHSSSFTQLQHHLITFCMLSAIVTFSVHLQIMETSKNKADDIRIYLDSFIFIFCRNVECLNSKTLSKAFFQCLSVINFSSQN